MRMMMTKMMMMKMMVMMMTSEPLWLIKQHWAKGKKRQEVFKIQKAKCKDSFEFQNRCSR